MHLHLRKRFDLYLEGAVAGFLAWCILEARWTVPALARLNDAYFWAWITDSVEILAALPLLRWVLRRSYNSR
jgi:hypothetical protein